MLKQRVLTAVPLAAFVIWGLITQPADIVFYAILFLIFISGWEWSGLSGVKNTLYRVIYALLITFSVFIVEQFVASNRDVLVFVLLLSVLTWCVIIYHMFLKGPQVANQNLSYFKLFFGFIILIPPVLGLMLVRVEGEWWLFYCLSIVWIADIGAYFSGKRFGKNKLAPKLSPGKTKEGMVGAIVFTAIYSIIVGFLFKLPLISQIGLLIITVLAAVISVAGDLFVSLLKREKGLKDTGNILPGHGGILDRIDSVLSSAPFLALLLNMVIFDV